MKTRFAFAFALAALAQSALAADPYFAQVDASFAAMLSHQPYAGPTAIAVVSDEPDLVAALVYARLRGEAPAETVVAIDFQQDQVTASFGRMLAHEVYAGPTAITVARQQDHAVDRLVFVRRHAPAHGQTLLANNH